MSKINLLTSDIYNKIAAGEVVERPSSVVKELVENSIDSGATEIKIEIFAGGIEKICITDNGFGMDKEDMQRSILPHATSKIHCADDLSNIATLGFRGEALASICSVAKVKITSKTAENEVANQMEVENGKIVAFGETAMQTGTTIEVCNLFENVPARKKFLKSERSEKADITNLVSRLILANPNVRIKYYADDEKVYNFDGKGLDSAINCVYNKDYLENSINFYYEEENYKIWGRICKPDFCKPTRTYQNLILNGRFIQNATISQAISNAYSDFVFKRQFPFYVLNFEVRGDLVDVNAHPTKMEVRFLEQNRIFGLFYKNILFVLQQDAKDKSLLQDFSANIEQNSQKYQYVENNNTNDKQNIDQFAENIVQNSEKTASIAESNLANAESHFIKDTKQKENNPLPFKYNFDAKNESFFDSKKQNYYVAEPTFDQNVQKTAQNEQKVEQLDKSSEKTIENIENSKIDQQIKKFDTKFVGSIFETYIILQNQQDMLLVDQHALAERINFDKIMEVQSTLQSTMHKQNMLIPYILNIDFSNVADFLNLIPILNSLGFEIEEFGSNSFKINTIPAILTDINLKLFFDDVMFDLNTFKGLSDLRIIKEKLAQKACKRSIKAGYKMGEFEANYLISKLKDGIPLCPHGRPICVKITKSELEKMFKRRV